MQPLAAVLERFEAVRTPNRLDAIIGLIRTYDFSRARIRWAINLHTAVDTVCSHGKGDFLTQCCPQYTHMGFPIDVCFSH